MNSQETAIRGINQRPYSYYCVWFIKRDSLCKQHILVDYNKVQWQERAKNQDLDECYPLPEKLHLA